MNVDMLNHNAIYIVIVGAGVIGLRAMDVANIRHDRSKSLVIALTPYAISFVLYELAIEAGVSELSAALISLAPAPIVAWFLVRRLGQNRPVEDKKD